MGQITIWRQLEICAFMLHKTPTWFMNYRSNCTFYVTPKEELLVFDYIYQTLATLATYIAAIMSDSVVSPYCYMTAKCEISQR